jgi:dTDP-glucose 4,6-dehydratase
VTGGAGFIGSNFIHHVLGEHEDVRVVNLDKLTYAGNLQNLADIESTYGLSASTNNQDLRTKNQQPRYFFVKGDITDRDLVDSLFSGKHFSSQALIPNPQDLRPNIVVNFAAESHVDRSMLDASPFVDANIKGTQVLLDAARAHWHCNSDSRLPTIDSRRFIHISTDEVYGSLDEDGLFSEESPICPNNPYSATKAAAELLCRAYHKAYGVPVIVTRSSNNYGPYQFPEKLIPLMIRNALNGRPLPVYGEGKQIRDWLYVDDNCRAIDLVLRNGKVGEVYNIGGRCEKQNIEVVEAICDILKNHPKTQDLGPKIQHIKDPRGAAHDFRYALDSSKIKKELGWEPECAFEEGLERTVAWYLENQDWVENVITGEYQEYYEKIYGPK